MASGHGRPATRQKAISAPSCDKSASSFFLPSPTHTSTSSFRHTLSTLASVTVPTPGTCLPAVSTSKHLFCSHCCRASDPSVWVRQPSPPLIAVPLPRWNVQQIHFAASSTLPFQLLCFQVRQAGSFRPLQQLPFIERARCIDFTLSRLRGCQRSFTTTSLAQT